MKLHIGCGANYKHGWINIDAQTQYRCDLYHDLTRPLPYAANTASFMYSQHFIEHLTREEGIVHLQDCYRVLKPGGVIRISCPDLAIVVYNYLYNFRIEPWVASHAQVDSPCQYLNIGLRAWGHQYVYDEQELSRILSMIGFKQITRSLEGQSIHPELCNLETRAEKGLILEGVK